MAASDAKPVPIKNTANRIYFPIYYLDLTAAEMNGYCIVIMVKTSTEDAKTSVLILYPNEAGDIKVDSTHISGASDVLNAVGATEGGSWTLAKLFKVWAAFLTGTKQ